MANRRLENSDEEKFWEAWIKDDTIFCFRFGKIGTSGQTRLKRHASRAEADADLEDNVSRKLKEGFEEVGEGAPAKAADDEDEETESEDEKESDDEEESEDEEESDEEESDDEEDEEEEEEAPKKKKRAAPKLVVAAPAPAPPPKSNVPTRKRANPNAIAPEQISAAKSALEALHAAVGKRSWQVRRLARRARQALERVAGVDPQKHGFGDALDAVMHDVFATKRLPLEIATSLLLELDAAVFVRTVKAWKSHADDAGPAKDVIAALVTSVEAIHDAEVALHVGAAFADRRLDAASWRKRFEHVKPALEQTLGKSGSTLSKYLKSIDASDDDVLLSRVEEAAR